MNSKERTVRIDAHQHFWKYNKEEYGWIDDSMSTLRRDFLPQDLVLELRENAIDFTVAVQARQSLQESNWLIELAKQNRFIKGVVGWVDLRNDLVERDIENLCQHEKFKGVRHILQDEEDNFFMFRKDFLAGISKLKKFDLTYDILIFPRQIKYVSELVNKFPDQLFVVDHLAKPFIKKGQLQPWKDYMHQLAKADNVYCKLSGMVTEDSWDRWKDEDFVPYMEAILEMFGPARLMFGSDWPVCTVAARYEEVLCIVTNFISSLSDDEQARIMGLNAVDFYNLEI